MEQLSLEMPDAGGLTGPCACGCGTPTRTKYARGHGRRLRIDADGRQCGSCREYKTWDEFHISRANTYGHTTICKACISMKLATAMANGEVKRATAEWQSVKLCECNCGQPTNVAGWTNVTYGYVKGQPTRFLRGHQRRGKTFSDPEARRERARAKSRVYYAQNRERLKARQKEWRTSTGYQRPPGANYRSNYGITWATYLRMVIVQCGACAICGTVPSEDPDAHKKTARLYIDHDHDSGRVRALLCSACNLMLGQSGDSPARLRDGAAYLAEWAGLASATRSSS